VLFGKRHKEFGEAKGRNAERPGASESTPGPVRRIPLQREKTEEGEPNNPFRFSGSIIIFSPPSSVIRHPSSAPLSGVAQRRRVRPPTSLVS